MDGGPESNFGRFVMGQTMGKMHVVGVHLWLEHLLAQCLKTRVAHPKPLFRDRGMGFAQLVSLCEALQIVDTPLAEVLRTVNRLRNKCAHDLEFNPGDNDWRELAAEVRRVLPDMPELADVDSLRHLADHLENKAIALGAMKPFAQRE